jgi:hypothetical protein
MGELVTQSVSRQADGKAFRKFAALSPCMNPTGTVAGQDAQQRLWIYGPLIHVIHAPATVGTVPPLGASYPSEHVLILSFTVVRLVRHRD